MRAPTAVLALLPLAPTLPAGTQTPALELRAADAAALDFFGKSTDADLHTLVIGATGSDTPTADTGAAYVFVRSGTAWTQQAKLVSSDAATDDSFGEAVAVELDTLVVGAPGDDDAAASSGSAYVFVRNGTSWSQQAKLTAIDADQADWFGQEVSISSDTVAVGAPYDSNQGGPYAGSVHVFVRQGTPWTQQAKLRGQQVGAGDYFGASVSIEGDRLVAGAPEAASDDGAAYVFHRFGTQWAQVARLVPDDPTGVTSFGVSIGLSGDRVAVGSTTANGGNGAIFVFAQQGTSWVEEARLAPSDATPDAGFGLSLSLAGDTFVAGGTWDAELGYRAGAAWVFQRDAALGWGQRRKLVFAAPRAEAGLGGSVALAGETVFAGAPGDSVVAENAGAVYVFDAPPRFDSFCDAGDGSLASCPCGAGSPDAGCELAQSTGGVALDVLARETSPPNRATLAGTGFPGSAQPAAVVIRAATLDASAPVVFGDGLRCVGTPVVRLGASTAAGGQSLHVVGHSAMAGTGDFHYQLWFRNAPLAFCDPTAAFNLSSGCTIPW